MKRVAPLEVVKEDFVGTETSLLDETWKNAFPVEISPEPTTIDSKELRFQIKAKAGCWYDPSKSKLFITLKVRKADNSRFTDPTAAVPATPTEHCRLINNAAAHIIKKIEVKPHGAHDVDVVGNFLSLEEYHRFIHVTSKEEKEKVELIYDKYYHKDLLCGPNENCVGQTPAQPKDARQAAAFLLESHLFDSDTITLVIQPIPGYFHEIHSPLSSLIDYEMKITLQSNNYMLISRRAHDDGAGAAVAGAKYQLVLDQTFVQIDYKQLDSEENEKMQHNFFSKDKLKFDTFDRLEVAISPSIRKSDVATGVEIKPFHALDNKVPDRFFFGVINANHYDNGSLTTTPALFYRNGVTKIQFEIDGKPIFTANPINWENNRSTSNYLFKLQSDMVAEEGEEERDNIGQFNPLNIQHGQWWGWIDVSPNRKKGFRNRIRKIDGTFTARIWFNANGGDNVYLVVGWYEQSELELSEPRNNGWTPKRAKKLPLKIPVKLNNIRNGKV